MARNDEPHDRDDRSARLKPGRQFTAVMKPNGNRTVTPPAELPKHLMQVDFSEYGYTIAEIRELFTLKEPPQVSHGRFAREKREAERVLDDFKAKKEKKEARAEKDRFQGVQVADKRQQVYLDAERKWVLFDPTRGWPPTMESHPPPVYEKYSRYARGNTKVVAYNKESYAVTLRRVPAFLKDAVVAYEKSGPKVMAKTKRVREILVVEE